jgi:peptidoglycan hydrolase-like protein with peptidoglycan-binding domain
MACERNRRPLVLLAALAVVTIALALPPAGRAAERAQPASAGLLARGSGYDTARGSDPVRVLQRRLRRLGDRPGPIDGLYGPLTEGAVERFQQRHDLAVDGIVGRQTKRRLYANTGRPEAAPARHRTQPGNLERKSPAPQIRAESAEEQHPARPATTGAQSRAGPEAKTGVTTEVLALVVGCAGLLLLTVLWKGREASVNFGLACAALLGVFGIGAAVGAIFATQSAPDGVGEATAQTGALLAEPAAAGDTRGEPVRRKTVAGARARRSATDAPVPGPAAAPPAPEPPRVVPRAASPPTPTAAPAPIRRARPVPRAKVATYVVKPGDSLSRIATRELGAGSPGTSVVGTVAKLTKLNVDDRIRSGDPDVLEVGEELRLP